MRAYGPRVGRGPTPPAHSLTHPQLEPLGAGVATGVGRPVAPGGWTLDGFWLRLGSILMAIGVVLFIADMLGVLKHLWLPATTATTTPTVKPTLTPSQSK